MSQTWVRVGGGIVAFVVAAAAGIYLVGGFGELDPDTGTNTTGANYIALILAVALVIGFLVYALIEWLQTRRFDSISRQFDTRTIVLMPLAIAFNIILGQAVASALKIPIYLDSIGTILVGALAGPIPGALTGLLSNLLWSYVVPPPLNSPVAGAFAIVAAIIGLLAGTYARLGWLRPRPDTPTQKLIVGGGIAVALIVVMALLAWLGYTSIMGSPDSLAPTSDNTLFVILGWVAILLVVGTVDRPHRAARHQARPDRRVRGRHGCHHGHRGGGRERAHQRQRVRRRHRIGHGLPGPRVPAGGERHPGRDTGPGLHLRPHRQGHDLLRGLHHPGCHGPPDQGPLPPG